MATRVCRRSGLTVIALSSALLVTTFATSRAAAARIPPSKNLEKQAEQLIRRAESAEAAAAWHEQRARVWEEITANQDHLRDFASAQEPLGGFNAEMHRNQKEKKLRQARELRREVQRLTDGRR